MILPWAVEQAIWPASRKQAGWRFRAARSTSVVVSPPLVPIFALLVIAGQTAVDPLAAALFALGLAGVPAIFVVLARWAGWVSDFGIGHRHERHRIHAVAVASAAGCFVLLARMGADATLTALAGATAVQVALLAAVTVRDKISIHAASAGGLAVAGWVVGGGPAGIVLTIVAIATGWSRWYLGKHTMRQIAGGWLTAIVTLGWLLRP